MKHHITEELVKVLDKLDAKLVKNNHLFKEASDFFEKCKKEGLVKSRGNMLMPIEKRFSNCCYFKANHGKTF